MEGYVSWPADVAERYRREGHWAGITIGQMFEASVRAHGSRTALVAGKQRLTYTELDALVQRVAGHLLRLGFGTYDRVILQLPNVAEFVIVYFACQRIGVIPLTCLPAFRHAEVEYFASFIEARGFLLEERRIARFKVPERLEVVDAFPLTAVGKVFKQALRQELHTRLESA